MPVGARHSESHAVSNMLKKEGNKKQIWPPG